MIETTLCYIENNGCYLMLHRIKKDGDVNAGKWIGIGGKLEPGETPDECIARETAEETGLKISSFTPRGVIYFYSDLWESEKMYLYSAKLPFTETSGCGDFTDEGAGGGSRSALPEYASPECDLPEYTLPECDEGVLKWIPFSEIPQLPLWEGDRIFLPNLMAGETDINLTRRYEGDKLIYSGETEDENI